MQRRELLEKMIAAAVAAGWVSHGSLAMAGAGEPGPESSPETAAWLDRELRLLAARDSSEQGIPMILALENLETKATASQAPEENAALQAKFEHYADLLLEYKSNPDESDAVALIVLLANQGLMPGAAEVCR